MKLVESYDNHSCEACDNYGYVYKLIFSDDEYGDRVKLCLCKKCLLKLQKLIYER